MYITIYKFIFQLQNVLLPLSPTEPFSSLSYHNSYFSLAVVNSLDIRYSRQLFSAKGSKNPLCAACLTPNCRQTKLAVKQLTNSLPIICQLNTRIVPSGVGRNLKRAQMRVNTTLNKY